MHAGKGRLRASEELRGGPGRTTDPMVQREQAGARQPGIGGGGKRGDLGASAAGEGVRETMSGVETANGTLPF